MKNASLKGVPAPQERASRLADLRMGKMARSAHAYVRGSADRFYAWLDSQAPGTLPEGPPVWICGDCHLGNLGPLADASGQVAVQIRDLDQSVIGNPAHDLLRLGLSLTTAARSADLPGVITSRMAQALIDGYEQAFDDTRSDETKRAQRPKVVKVAMKQALHRSWRKLDRQTIDGVAPRIPLGKRFWPLSAEEAQAVRSFFESQSGLAVREVLGHAPSGDARIDVLDAAFWVKGCSSLGRRRYAVLLDIDGKCSSGGPPCLVDIKQATTAAAPRHAGATMPRDNAKRVEEGARHVSPRLGGRMLAARLDGCAVVIRELMPQDLKFDADRLTEADAVKAAHFLALVVGQAHAEQMDAQTRRAWLEELRAWRPRSTAAPSWLWRCMVELAVAHEAEYLEHCRRYALQR
ncbi:DUF2252 domain-containing protein [Paraburkholderia sp. CNPSo 3272]|uniref:DUF2252 family protein n=1 Tax=Paraburkholderia sp. CNPSo 3272 TaxID=2940931 RepID=UPI0020B7CE33|nr:DUF2252 family protein [Paraburkholderia sp. CNPSo 3272]MCP3727723.1 DUF2252 domain-containing protein [Paraburkholderia sp. CNPSo 3272]